MEISNCNILGPLNQPKLENTTAFISNSGQRISSELFDWETTGGAVTQLTTTFLKCLSPNNLTSHLVSKSAKYRGACVFLVG